MASFLCPCDVIAEAVHSSFFYSVFCRPEVAGAPWKSIWVLSITLKAETVTAQQSPWQVDWWFSGFMLPLRTWRCHPPELLYVTLINRYLFAEFSVMTRWAWVRETLPRHRIVVSDWFNLLREGFYTTWLKICGHLNIIYISATWTMHSNSRGIHLSHFHSSAKVCAKRNEQKAGRACSAVLGTPIEVKEESRACAASCPFPAATQTWAREWKREMGIPL